MSAFSRGEREVYYILGRSVVEGWRVEVMGEAVWCSVRRESLIVQSTAVQSSLLGAAPLSVLAVAVDERPRPGKGQ